jgi:hypothetical protein
MAFRPRYPCARHKIEFSNEPAILPHMAVKWRMVALVHGDLETAHRPFSHVVLTDLMLSHDNNKEKANAERTHTISELPNQAAAWPLPNQGDASRVLDALTTLRTKFLA